jgi:2,3-bisphosphoglycerate-dependent phosphoglycerate mutase
VNNADDSDMTLWIIRHGESTWNVLGLIQGHADGPTLTDKGRRQSVQAAAQFRRGDVGAIYSSDLERARETAAFIGSALGLPVATDLALRERCFGSFEGLPLSALETAESGICGDQVVDAAARPEGGESLDEVHERVGAFLEKLREQHDHGDVILVSHGGAIRAMRAFCTGVAMTGTQWDVVPNGSVSRVRQLSISSSPK